MVNTTEQLKERKYGEASRAECLGIAFVSAGVVMSSKKRAVKVSGTEKPQYTVALSDLALTSASFYGAYLLYFQSAG